MKPNQQQQPPPETDAVQQLLDQAIELAARDLANAKKHQAILAELQKLLCRQFGCRFGDRASEREKNV